METFLTNGPVTVGGLGQSRVFEFSVLNEEENKFLRFIALWHDGEPLQGKAPTFEIRASSGLFTPVGPDSGEVSIIDSSGNEVGLVHCKREQPNDIFLLTITNRGENLNPWKIRFTNNDSESLRFLGFCSEFESKTLQPWMVLGQASKFIGHNEQRTEQKIEVRNWGTAPLKFDEIAGTPLGGEDSPVKLVKRPDFVNPHQVGILIIEARNIQRSAEFLHTFLCNDPIEEHRKLTLEVVRRPDCQPLRDELGRLREEIAKISGNLSDPDIPSDLRRRLEASLRSLEARSSGVFRSGPTWSSQTGPFCLPRQRCWPI